MKRVKGVKTMLCLSLLPGEYVTIGDDVVVQYDQTVGERCRISLKAPREVPIIRGEVLERAGGERPDCVQEKRPPCRREIPWDRSRAQALNAMRKLLSEMDDNDSRVKALRRQLNHMFPPETKDAQ